MKLMTIKWATRQLCSTNCIKQCNLGVQKHLSSAWSDMLDTPITIHTLTLEYLLTDYSANRRGLLMLTIDLWHSVRETMYTSPPVAQTVVVNIASYIKFHE